MAVDPWNPMPEGLPRPLGTLPGGDKAPVPWSQDGTKWGHTDPTRIDLAREFSRCLVCGEPVVEGKVLVILEHLPEGHPGAHHLDDLGAESADAPGYVLDQGPLHDRCVAITADHCPAVKRRVAVGEVAWQHYENPEYLPMPPDHWTDGVTRPRSGSSDGAKHPRVSADVIYFRELDEANAEEVRSWFDEEAVRHLGDPELIDQVIDDPDHTTLTVSVSGALVGLLIVRDHTPSIGIGAGEREALISMIVAPASRGRGVGTALIAACIRDPRFAEFEMFAAGVDADNQASRRALAANGFEPEEAYGEDDYERRYILRHSCPRDT